VSDSPSGARRLATLAVTMGTFVSVLNNTIVAVPVRDIAADLHVSIGAVSLVSTAVNMTFGGMMPLAGWIGNRFGRRTVFSLANALLALGGIACALAPNLPSLVVLRIIQGAASACLTPIVIALLAELYPPLERPRALSNWAAANALGQAVGPPAGGLLASLLGWRATVLVPGALALASTALSLRSLPRDRPEPVPLDWRSAFSLTVGALLALAAIAWMPQLGPLAPPILVAFAGSALCIAAFGWATAHAVHPFVSPEVLRDASYVRSSIGVFTGSFSLGTGILVVPLYLTGGLHLSTAVTGFIAFVLPLAMVLTARPGSVLIRRTSSAFALGCALATLTVMGLALAVLAHALAPAAALVPFAFALGMGISVVHTACAVGSTTTPAARYGAGVGLFNLIRAAGTTAGIAWVALIVQRWPDGYAEVFVGSAAIAALGLALTAAVRERPARS
jgi:MFS family permease